MSRLLAWVKAAVVKEKKEKHQTRFQWMYLCPVRPGCTHATQCLHTCMCLSTCLSLCTACKQGYLHYTVTVHQSPAPRQPCRLATRVRFTKGRLKPGAKGEKTEGKRKGRTLRFHLELFYLSACSPRGSTFTPRKICQVHLKSTV